MSIASEILSIHEKSRKWYKDQYSSGFSDALKDASKVAERRELELFDQIRRLRAVIDEIPEVIYFVKEPAAPSTTGSKTGSTLEPVALNNAIKSLLLKKHGVEAT